MGVIPERIEYKNFPRELFVCFAEELSKRKICEKVAFAASNEKSHFDRYGFVRDNKKISVVYDNKARMMSVTASDDIMPVLSNLVETLKKSPYNVIKQSEKATEKPVKNNENEISKRKSDSKNSVSDADNRNFQKKSNNKSTQPNPSDRLKQQKSEFNGNNQAKGNLKSNSSEKSEFQNKIRNIENVEKINSESRTPNTLKKNSASEKIDKNQVVSKKNKKVALVKTENPEIKAGISPVDKLRAQSVTESVGDSVSFSKITAADNIDSDACGDISIKKYTVKRFGGVIDKLNADRKKYKLVEEEIINKGKATEINSYTVSCKGQKLKLRFMPKKGVVQLQGKRGTLFTELQLLLSEQTDYKAAVDAHIEQSREDKKAGQVERQLKKLIPDAFRFLSEQSKIDFTIGVIEILNSSDKHYDYSMLLLPPFRGLEKLIFDLQRAQGIAVKMIGQAYEKEEGNYVLKASYRRRINSIVYAEVMADLYREYFETRNFYTHSDSSEKNEVRIINKKEQAVAIFQNMLKKVEYNCKKLSEIGFSI